MRSTDKGPEARNRPSSAPNTIKRFRDEQRREGAYEYRDRGQQCVAVEQIVGSVNRYLDFDRRFRLKKDRPQERLVVIRSIMRQGKPLPPVDLYQIKNHYFVLDGNHRISVAKERGFSEINARVIEFLPSGESIENILYREQSDFQDRTGLKYTIRITEQGQYRHLLHQIEQHRQYLAESGGGQLSLKDAAADWYSTIYQPLVAIVERAGLPKLFPGRTASDLYAYISVHQWEQNHYRSFGSVVDNSITQSMEEFRSSMKDVQKEEYPEMLREITVFVLINISAKREVQILDRLFSLESVTEVHSVHGSIDIIAKLVLTRNLLSSDAEVISGYVQKNIRHIPGVLSTQTLIPGVSRMKEQGHAAGNRPETV